MTWPERKIWGRWWHLIKMRKHWNRLSDEELDYYINFMTPKLNMAEAELVEGFLRDEKPRAI